jgi:hypothetical protein
MWMVSDGIRGNVGNNNGALAKRVRVRRSLGRGPVRVGDSRNAEETHSTEDYTTSETRPIPRVVRYVKAGKNGGEIAVPLGGY